jgi:putative ABC transport system substrate-binding protein
MSGPRHDGLRSATTAACRDRSPRPATGTVRPATADPRDESVETSPHARAESLCGKLAPGKAVEEAGRTLRLQLQVVGARTGAELEGAFSSMVRARAQAVLVLASAFVLAERQRMAELAMRYQLLTMCGQREAVEAGGLMSYGPNFDDLFRRGAIYVDKILKGARPADLPIEQPTKFELVVNLKTAKALGLTIPQSVLLRADEVIQ